MKYSFQNAIHEKRWQMTLHIMSNLFEIFKWFKFNMLLTTLVVNFKIYENKRAFDITRFGSCWYVKILITHKPKINTSLATKLTKNGSHLIFFFLFFLTTKAFEQTFQM